MLKDAIQRQREAHERAKAEEEARAKTEQEAPEAPAAAPEPELSQEEKLAQFLESQHGIPARLLAEWKSQYKVYMLGFNDEDVVLYRPLQAVEHQALLAEAGKNPNFTDAVFNQKLVNLCVLYPNTRALNLDALPAGWADSVRTAIERVSCFLPPAEIASMIIRL